MIAKRVDKRDGLNRNGYTSTNGSQSNSKLELENAWPGGFLFIFELDLCCLCVCVCACVRVCVSVRKKMLALACCHERRLHMKNSDSQYAFNGLQIHLNATILLTPTAFYRFQVSGLGFHVVMNAASI